MLRHGWPGARQSRDRAAALERGIAGRREGLHPTAEEVLFLISEHVWSRRFKASSSQLLVRDILFLLLLFAVPTGAFLCAFDRRLAATGLGSSPCPFCSFLFLLSLPLSLALSVCLSFRLSVLQTPLGTPRYVRTCLYVMGSGVGVGAYVRMYVRACTYVYVRL